MNPNYFSRWNLEPVPGKLNTFFFRHVGTGKVLDVEGGSVIDRAKLIIFPKHGGPNQ